MLTVGMFVADRYEVVGKIGAGGMSDVYKAMDHVLERFVAIKVLKQEFAEDVNFVTKFRTEAQSAASLEHPNIVNIYDVGSENGIYYIVMEYVEGITLKTYIEKKGRLSYKEAVSIAIQVGRGIEAAHNKQIVHRDIKPQNVIISTEGKVKVTDFGIARAANTNTIHSDVMGSVHYSSPEQARNGYVDGKSDIYSLGIVMFEMVTGRVPFDGETTVAVAIQHLQEDMPHPSDYAPDLPLSLEKVILKCTQKNPDRRYQTISDLLVDLKKVLISPDEDFVTLSSPAGQDMTRVIPVNEVRAKRSEGSRPSHEREHEYEYEEEEEEEPVRRRANEDEDEDDGDDGFLNPRMEKIVTVMGIIAAVIIVAIIIYIMGSLNGLFRFGQNHDGDAGTQQEGSILDGTLGGDDADNEDPNGESTDENDGTQGGEDAGEGTVTMISVVGKTFDEAKAALNEMGLGIYMSGNEASDEYEPGQIISQSVEEGETVALNETINVVICSGPNEFPAPDVTGQHCDDADVNIVRAGLKAQREYSYDETVPEDHVISQTPSAGSMVKKGDVITYYVSRGAEKVHVPDVTNRTEAEARAMLAEAGFENITVSTEYNDTIPEGNVIRQEPEGESSVEQGVTVSLVVSNGRQTAYYSFHKTIEKPNPNATWLVELTGAESDEQIQVTVTDNGSSITLDAINIANFTSGSLYIQWSWTDESVLDENGNPIPNVQNSVTGPMIVSFDRQ